MTLPSESLRPVSLGLVFALLTALFGFGLGIAFGVAEDAFKDTLSASAQAVMAEVYQGDEAKVKSVLDKAWTYCKRAHMHAGALGTHALGIGLLLAFLGRTPAAARTAASLLVSLGGLGYSVFWLFAAFRAPGLGSTGGAKESLAWLAIPSSASVVIGTLMALVLLLVELARARRG